MRFLPKKVKIEYVLVCFIMTITFLTRAFNLLAVPIFTDEAIYIRWAQIGLNDPDHRFISLTDGKQPLLTWAMYPMLKIFSDPLYAGRFVSVLSGTLAVAGLYAVAKELYGKKTGVFASILYIISPFAMVYDRLALYDSQLNMLGLWAMYFGILLVKKRTVMIAILLGLIAGLGMLNKSSAVFFIYSLPATLILLPREFFYERKRELLRWGGLAVLSFLISQVMYQSLRISPWFYMVKQKNYVFILTIQEFLQAPFAVMVSNLRGMIPMVAEYLTPTMVLLLVSGLIWAGIKRDLKTVYIFIWFIFPFMALAVSGKVIFPRYMLFMTIPLFIICAHTLSVVSKKMSSKVFAVIAFLILAYPLYQTILLDIRPVYADIPKTDRNQLFDDWPSGYGVRETIEFLKDKSKEGKVIIGTEGTFGLFPAAYEIYLQDNPNVEIHGYWPLSAAKEPMVTFASKYPTYFVLKDTPQIPPDWPVTLVRAYPRGISETNLYFFKVHPK